MNLNVIRSDFPIFKNNPDLVYLDSGATSLKPQVVIDSIVNYYTKYSANIHRGIYKLSEKATEEYEKARVDIARFIGATNPSEVIFTRSTTESLNLIAYSLGRQLIQEGDEVVVTVMEHHSNFVPWQVLAAENGGVFKVIDVNAEGYLGILKSDKDGYVAVDTKALASVITKKTKLFAITHVSNVLGVVNPIGEIIRAVRGINPDCVVVVDGAQAVPGMPIDVASLDCDFYAFSGHKMLGPTGIGILWGKASLLDSMYPFQYGGDMISNVTIESTSFQKGAQKFEAGTPNIAGAIGLGAAAKYLEGIGMENVQKHEQKLARYAIQELTQAFGKDIIIIGPANIRNRTGIVAFSLKGVHPHDIAQILDDNSVAVRAGHHCAMPLHTSLGVQSSVRASFQIYNTDSDVDKLVAALKKAQELFA